MSSKTGILRIWLLVLGLGLQAAFAQVKLEEVEAIKRGSIYVEVEKSYVSEWYLRINDQEVPDMRVWRADLEDASIVLRVYEAAVTHFGYKVVRSKRKATHVLLVTCDGLTPRPGVANGLRLGVKTEGHGCPVKAR